MKRRWLEWAALIALALGATVALYPGATQLPFFSDDLLQVPWAARRSYLDFWRELTPYGDYRPLHFALWHLLMEAAGGPSPFVLHALNLLWQIAAATLFGGFLLRRRRVHLWEAAVGLLLFAAYPFAFDAVLWVSALSYPMSLALTLAALLLHLRAREEGAAFSRGALLLVLLAAFSYEGAIVAGLTLLLAEWLLVERRPPSVAAWLYPFASLGAALVIARHALGEGFRILWEKVPGNLLAWWQALLYPVAPLALKWPGGAERGLLALGGAALLLTAYAAWRGGRLRLWLFGVGWAALWGAVPVATQPFEWSRDPLRVFYAVGMGAALLWWAAWQSAARRKAVALMLGAALLLPAASFVREETMRYRQAGRLIGEVVAASREPGSEAGLLFINLPGRITPEQRRYPLGHEGVIPLPPPTDVAALVVLNGGREVPVRARAAGWILPPLPYHVEPVGALLGPDDFRGVRRVLLTDFAPEGTMHLDAVAELEGVCPSQEAAWRFEDGVALLALRCEREAGGGIVLTLRWQMQAVLPDEPTLFVHLLADDRQTILAQADGDPIAGLYPFRLWREGEVVVERRRFPPTEGGRWIRFGLWEPSSGRRLGAVDGEGTPAPEGFLWCQP